jgi:phenylacetate-CoA ligase
MAMPNDMPWEFLSATPGSAWPAVPGYGASAVLGLLWQMAASERLSTAQIEAQQLRQLGLLARHAWNTVPYYRSAWTGRYDPAAPLSRERLTALPLLARRALQERYEEIKSKAAPPEHGRPTEARTSGSTGAPVRVLANGVTHLFWKACSLRDHAWHCRDLSRKLAVIRRGVSPGTAPTWGATTEGLVRTGECASMDVEADVDAQLDWLARERPAYLLSYPSLAAELARASLRRALPLPGLLEVRTIGEALGAEVRQLCREAWGVPLTDAYSAEEVGYIAMQCPQHEHYHVQAENLLVEVLDEGGAPCAPGQTGRVVVSDLHNFATPLIRYEIGDYAEPGELCDCGRGLPVLRRILGRTRNMLVTRDGRRFWPAFGSRGLMEIGSIRQHQFAQTALDAVEARLVVGAPLGAEREERLRRHVLGRLPPGFSLTIAYRDAIARSAGGKYEEFVSELPSA